MNPLGGVESIAVQQVLKNTTPADLPPPGEAEAPLPRLPQNFQIYDDDETSQSDISDMLPAEPQEAPLETLE